MCPPTVIDRINRTSTAVRPITRELVQRGTALEVRDGETAIAAALHRAPLPPSRGRSDDAAGRPQPPLERSPSDPSAPS
jgi:hypothetical protein